LIQVPGFYNEVGRALPEPRARQPRWRCQWEAVAAGRQSEADHGKVARRPTRIWADHQPAGRSRRRRRARAAMAGACAHKGEHASAVAKCAVPDLADPGPQNGIHECESRHCKSRRHGESPPLRPPQLRSAAGVGTRVTAAAPVRQAVLCAGGRRQTRSGGAAPPRPPRLCCPRRPAADGGSGEAPQAHPDPNPNPPSEPTPKQRQRQRRHLGWGWHPPRRRLLPPAAPSAHCAA
jgi:hypothetical protein